jgi:hypothetical protein
MPHTPLPQTIKDEKVYTKSTPGRGNGVFAKHEIPAKAQVLFVERPLLMALNTNELASRCYHCMRSPTDRFVIAEDEPVGIKACGRCKVVKFCNQVRFWVRSSYIMD